MEMSRNKEEENNLAASLWGGSSYIVPMAENHYQNHNQYSQPCFNHDDSQTTYTQTPASLMDAFNRLNLSYSTPPSPLHQQQQQQFQQQQQQYMPQPNTTLTSIDRVMIERQFLIEEVKRMSEELQQMQMMFRKPFNERPLLNNCPPVYDDHYPKLLNNTGVNGEGGECPCNLCLKNESMPKQYSSSSLGRISNRGGSGSVDSFESDLGDYYNMSRINNNSQFHQLMNQTKFTSLEELRGRMASVAKDQHGGRFLQKKIEGGRKEDIDLIFSEIKDHLGVLMVDQFGNYLVQKLLDACNGEQRNDIVIALTRRENVLVKICCDMHGTRAVQKLLERLTSENQQARIVSALTPGTYDLITDTNGHHVIQYCVKHFPNELKKDRSGCCVLQLCVEHSHGEIKERLVAEITRNAALLAEDPYGNYVVQYLLGLKIPQYTAKLLRELEGSFVRLSMQKFSSNVVERCLKESNEDQATQIVKEMANSPDVLKLLQDAFGNYVVQSALTVSFKTPVFFVMVDLVKMHDLSLRSHPYGKRILARVDQLTK
ncbi:hypothetical protein IFM89_007918 [Coptis chinensis]|uniref:PUM-HD domain-containing protein n=1 Tax=Coptis chinensis TaxID=261450 RepID=A0A835M7T7_9MAGN|nr:hypothetical protein IFM89_007918 [Coptis chinensis]